MKLFFKAKDGGPLSKVTGYWLIECKSIFSIALLKFEYGSRETYHNHAFNAISWVLIGKLKEEILEDSVPLYLSRTILPIYTSRKRCHKVTGMTNATWVISFRGPWSKKWLEYDKVTGTYTTLTNGRKVIND